MLRFRDQAEYDRHRRSRDGYVDRNWVEPEAEKQANLIAQSEGLRTTAEGWPLFEAMLRAHKLPIPVYEYRFHISRRWRFDMAWPEHQIAIEVDGGAWGGGRHNRPAGFLADLEKMNAAVLAGWRVLRYPPEKLAGAIDDLKAIIDG